MCLSRCRVESVSIASTEFGNCCQVIFVIHGLFDYGSVLKVMYEYLGLLYIAIYRINYSLF